MAKLARTQAAPSKERSFEEFLVQQGILPVDMVARVQDEARAAKKSFPDVLLQDRLLGEEEFARARADFLHLSYVDLRAQDVPRAILDLVSQDVMQTYQFVPFAKDDETIHVAITDPTNLTALEAIEYLAHREKVKPKLYVASPTSVNTIVQKAPPLTRMVGEAVEEIAKEERPARAVEEETRPILKEAPIAKIVDVMVRNAIEGKASDIHIEPEEQQLRVRFRVDGILHASLTLPKTLHPPIVSRIKILAGMKIEEQRLPQDGRFHIDIDKKSVDFRVSTLPTVNGEKVVLRILDKTQGVPSLTDLGLSGKNLQWVQEAIKRPHGMLLVTGPTGSGKSTTLYSVLSMLNQPGVNIITLEDPVEYFMEGVNQVQVKPEIGLTFASGLRSILRQDPNIIMVGEIRDKETAELAVHAALTGHLVFATLHTNDAVGAIPRLVDMGIEPFLLTASVNGVVAQRLVRKICQKCKREVPPPQHVVDMIQSELQSVDPAHAEDVDLRQIKLFSGAGCPACGKSGYQGRCGIFEVLPIAQEIQDLILQKPSGARIQEVAQETLKMISMKQDGLLKVLRGITTIEEVLRVTSE